MHHRLQLALDPSEVTFSRLSPRAYAHAQGVQRQTLVHIDDTDHNSHEQKASMIRPDIRWRNRHTTDQKLRGVVTVQTMLDAALPGFEGERAVGLPAADDV